MPKLFTKNYKDFIVLDNDSGAVLRIFNDARLARKCLLGDEVSIDCPSGCELVNRADHPVIAGLIELNSKTKYGFTSRNTPIYLFCPFNEAYPSFVVGCSERDTTMNRLALVRFENVWTDTFPRGSLQRLLDVGAEEEALYWTYSPVACVNYKGTYPDPCPLNKRLILEDCFNIDPVGCKDVDDVLCFKNEEGKDYVYITIADVSAVVKPGDPLDLRAATICQTFYQDGVQPKPMFPSLMSDGQLSLLKGCKKPGLTLKVCLEDLTTSWFLTAVNVSETYDYESIYNATDLVCSLKKMSKAFGFLSEDSHEWIEAAMKFYNVTAAKILKANNVGALRSHSSPDMERFNKLDPSLSFLAMSAAKYVPASTSDCRHWGLNEDAYCHATSPIRRYADLVNQRYLKALLFGDGDLFPHINFDRLNAVAKAAKQHDRDLIFVRALKKAKTGTVCGKIVEIRGSEDLCKLSIYVEQWSLIVKLKYKKGHTEGTVISKDEKETVAVAIGQQVTIAYHANMSARAWKRRMVMKLS